MRIPQFQYSRVPQAQTIDTSAIAGAARAQMGVSKTLVDVGTQFGEQVAKAETDAEYLRLTNAMQEDSVNLWNGLDEKTPVVDETGASTYESLQEQFDKGFKDIQNKYRDQIKWHQNKSAYGAAASDFSLRMNSTVTAGIRTRRVDYLKGVATSNLNGLRHDDPAYEAKLNDVLSTNLQNGVFTPSEYEKLLFSHTREHDENVIKSAFQQARDSGTPKSTQNFIDDFIKNENKEQRSLTDQTDVDAMVNYMRIIKDRDQAVIEGEKRKAKAEFDAAQKTLVDDAKRDQGVLESGAIVGESFVEGYLDRIGQIADPDEKQALMSTVNWYAEGQSIIQNTASLSELYTIRGTLASGVVETAEQGERRDALLKTVDNVISQINADPLKAAVSLGILNPQETTLRDAITNNELPAFVRDMANRKKLVDAKWGLTSDLFADEDVSVLSEYLESQEGFEAMGQLVKEAGHNTHTVLKKIFQKGYATIAIAGDLATQSDSAEVLDLLSQGRKMAKSEGGLDAYDIDKELSLSAFNDHVGTGEDSLIGNDWQYRKALKTSIDQVYAAMLARTSASGDWDEDVYKAAVAAVAGTKVSVNGQDTFAPNRTITGDDFEEWVDNLTAKDFEGVHIDDITALSKLAQDGHLKPVYFGEQGKYYIKIGDNMFLKHEDGSDFVLEYK